MTIQISKKKTIFVAFSIFFLLAFVHQIMVSIRKEPGVSIFLDDLFTDVFNGANDQIQVDSKILIKTIQFMIEERDQYDEEVVEFVRRAIVAPSSKPLNLVNSDRVHFSQGDQSELVDQILKERRDGFFIEAGGFDGESYSNSLFFERERNWTGIIIEPIPRHFSQILAKNRHAYALNACISRSKPAVVKFQVDNVFSGKLSGMPQPMKDHMDNKRIFKKFAYVPCFSINTILKAIEVNKVDYFSLDVEGGEPDVIESIDFDNFEFDVFTIECFSMQTAQKRMVERMKAHGFNLYRYDGKDLVMVMNQKRKMSQV